MKVTGPCPIGNNRMRYIHSMVLLTMHAQGAGSRMMTTVKLLIEAPGFYSNKCLRPPACIGDPAYIRDPASIKT